MSRFIFSNQDQDGTYSLYSTDGTAAGTTDLQAARFGFVPDNSGVVDLSGDVLFVGLGITYSGILQVIYRSDGTAIGTSDALVAGTGGTLVPTGLWTVDKNILTSGFTATGPQGLYASTDGVTFTEIETGAGVGQSGIIVSNKIGYFGAAGGGGGSLGLWRTDGTSAGTFSITPAGQTLVPAELTAVGNRLLFSNAPPGGATTLWTTDGTAANTIPLQVPGLSNVYSETNLLSLGGKALFVASAGPDAYGSDGLWATDGSAGGTTEIYSAVYPNQLSTILSPLGSRAVFSNGTNLLITDGTASGTSIIPTPTSSIQNWVVLGSSVIYAGAGTSRSAAGANSLFSYDTSTGATVQVTLPGVNIDQSTLTLTGGQVILTATDPSGAEAFYATDGTQAGTGELALPAGVTLSASGSTVLAGLPDAPPPVPTPSVVTLSPNQNYIAAAGTTVLASSSGSDTVTASAGQVTVVGSSGSLAFIGGTGASSVAGGAGSSTIFGGSGGGYFTGGRAGFNVLVSQGASGANTTLTGAGGGDQIFGSGSGNDMLIAGSGRDSLLGGSGHTTIQGGATASVIFTGGGSSVVFGGTGGGDTIVGGGGSLNVNAQEGDAIFGGSGAMNVTGSKTGADSIVGGSGSLVVDGQGGNMLVVAGTGTSSIDIGNGASLIFAGSGSSSVAGGTGSLQLLVGSGSTTVDGGTGPAVYDVIKGSAGGTDVVNGFRPATDQIQLFGYAAPDLHITTSDGSSLVSLSDGTRLQIVGVTDLGNSIIIS